MKENRKLLKEVLDDIRHDMTDEEVLSLLAGRQISVKPENAREKYTLGQRAADTIAKFAGSWAFIFSFTGVLVLWMIVNAVLALKAFDPYPFILLNLVLSCVAAIQAPLIMMSQNRQEEKVEELSLETVRKYGIENYGEEEIMGLCSRTIRENNYECDDFLTYVCFEMFKRKQFDRVILTYLANYYCGATTDMKLLWREAREYEVHTQKLAERIITQMLFSEELFGEVPIFEEYYEEGAYFRLQQAYLAYMSREYVVEERRMSRSIIDIICKEYEKGEETIDICKIAVLKYYSTREYTTTVRKTLKKFLQELCGKQIYFPFFLAYEKEWLIELQLWDKTLIEYKGQKGSRVMLYYQLQKENSEAVDYATEVLTPMYENLYVKKFVLFSNERLKYYFKETIDGNTYRSDKECCMKDAVFGESGRYGRLNDILLSEGSEKEEKMKAYAQEDAIAAHMFEQY